jgi:hypothetical protein
MTTRHFSNREQPVVISRFGSDKQLCSFSIANVLLQSGSTVPDWMAKLPKPSKMKRKQMGKVKRPEIVNNARKIGRRDALKRRFVQCCNSLLSRDVLTVLKHREMIEGSKRRKEKLKVSQSGT